VSRSRQLPLPPPLSARPKEYTVHLGVYGSCEGREVLIADGLLLGAPLNWLLLDTYVLRGDHSPRHLYTAPQRDAAAHREVPA